MLYEKVWPLVMAARLSQVSFEGAHRGAEGALPAGSDAGSPRQARADRVRNAERRERQLGGRGPVAGGAAGDPGQSESDRLQPL